MAVSGEALPYESLNDFRAEKGMILANASAVGMEPNTDQTPVSKVLYPPQPLESSPFDVCGTNLY